MFGCPGLNIFHRKHGTCDSLDALILCGGFATRLEPITLFVPKPLLPIAGRPILDHILESVESLDVDRIVLSTNKKFYDQFKYWADNKMATGSKKHIEIVMEPSMHHGEKFGAIKGINYTIENARLKNDLVVVAGDNFYNFDLARLSEQFKKTGNVTIALRNVKSVNEAKHFGVVEMDEDIVKGFQEKPAAPKSTLISTGIYVFPKETLSKFGEYIRDGNNPDAPGYFLQWLVKKEQVRGVVFNEEWYDIGTVDTYRSAFDRYMKK